MGGADCTSIMATLSKKNSSGNVLGLYQAPPPASPEINTSKEIGGENTGREISRQQ
jgi:hypothetical protein